MRYDLNILLDSVRDLPLEKGVYKELIENSFKDYPKVLNDLLELIEHYEISYPLQILLQVANMQNEINILKKCGLKDSGNFDRDLKALKAKAEFIGSLSMEDTLIIQIPQAAISQVKRDLYHSLKSWELAEDIVKAIYDVFFENDKKVFKGLEADWNKSVDLHNTEVFKLNFDQLSTGEYIKIRARGLFQAKP